MATDNSQLPFLSQTPKVVKMSISASPRSKQNNSPHWSRHITIDLILRALHKTFLHPFIAWLIPVCLRAQATPYSHPAFTITVAYAAILTFVLILAQLNKRIGYGAPREVDLEEEVVVVTGGASGVGLLIASMYGMRGVSVAVLDVKQPDPDGTDGLGFEEMPSVEYYRCDVGDRKQVEEVAKRIENDVRLTIQSTCHSILQALHLHSCSQIPK